MAWTKAGSDSRWVHRNWNMSDDIKKKILLIDDEKLLLNLYSIKFLKEGYDVFVCQSVDEGLDALRKGYKPDVILFDITMPEKNGYEFLEGVAQEHLAKHSLKIALTNEGQDAEKQRMGELGADAHILKGTTTPSSVVKMVTEMLKQKNR